MWPGNVKEVTKMAGTTEPAPGGLREQKSLDALGNCVTVGASNPQTFGEGCEHRKGTR